MNQYSSIPFVISSGVERSALPFGPSKKSQEISPCATLTSSNSVVTRDSQSELCSPLAAPSLSRDDGGGFPQWE